MFTVSAYFWINPIIQTPSTEIVTENLNDQLQNLQKEEIPTKEFGTQTENELIENTNNLETVQNKILDNQTTILIEDLKTKDNKIEKLEFSIKNIQKKIKSVTENNAKLEKKNTELLVDNINKNTVIEHNKREIEYLEKNLKKCVNENSDIVAENNATIDENTILATKMKKVEQAFQEIDSLARINIKIQNAKNSYITGKTKDKSKTLEIIENYILPFKKSRKVKNPNLDLGPETLDGTDFISETTIMVIDETVKFLNS